MLYCTNVPEQSLAAVSGGGDSVALLLLLSQQKVAFGVGHVRHGLSDWQLSAEQLVRDLSIRFNLAFRTEAIASPSKGGVGYEAKCRKERYRILGEIALELDAPAILTAHTFDDQLETIAIAERRKQGISALSGIPEKRLLQLTNGRSIEVIRPMLHIRRAEVREWLVNSGYKWVEDPGNSDPNSGLRSRIRFDWQSLSKTERASEERRLLALAYEALNRLQEANRELQPVVSNIGFSSEGEIVVATDTLRSLHSDSIQLFIVHVARAFQLEAGGFPAGHRRQFENSLKNGRWGAQGFLGTFLSYRIVRKVCRFSLITYR